MDIDKILTTLDQVPPTTLKLLELAREFTRPDGTLDYMSASHAAEELIEATREAQTYSRATANLAESLTCFTEPFPN